MSPIKIYRRQDKLLQKYSSNNLITLQLMNLWNSCFRSKYLTMLYFLVYSQIYVHILYLIYISNKKWYLLFRTLYPFISSFCILLQQFHEYRTTNYSVYFQNTRIISKKDAHIQETILENYNRPNIQPIQNTYPFFTIHNQPSRPITSLNRWKWK